MTKNQQEIAETRDKEPSLLAAQEEIEFLREQMESWQLLVKDLHSELDKRQQQINALEQELAQTNKELCQALVSHHQEITQVKQVARQIGRRQDSVSESLAALLNTIYDCAISASELEVEETSVQTAILPNIVAQQISDNSKELRTHSVQLKSQSHELGYQFLGSKASFRRLQEEVAGLTKLPQQSENEIVVLHQLKEYRSQKQVNLTQLKENLERTKELVDKQVNLTQLKENLERTKELVDRTKNYVTSVKLKSAAKKNFEKEDLCLA